MWIIRYDFPDADSCYFKWMEFVEMGTTKLKRVAMRFDTYQQAKDIAMMTSNGYGKAKLVRVKK